MLTSSGLDSLVDTGGDVHDQGLQVSCDFLTMRQIVGNQRATVHCLAVLDLSATSGITFGLFGMFRAGRSSGFGITGIVIGGFVMNTASLHINSAAPTLQTQSLRQSALLIQLTPLSHT